jgi:hypothetical protein
LSVHGSTGSPRTDLIRGSLDDFIVSDYVTTENIPQINLNGIDVKAVPSIFFKDCQYLTSIDINEILEGTNDDFVTAYKDERIFPYDFSIHFFDAFIVVDIFPRSMKTEFLVVAPLRKKIGIAQIMPGMAASIAMTSIFSTISSDPMAQVALYMKLDKLSEYLRSGAGKKKILVSSNDIRTREQ